MNRHDEKTMQQILDFIFQSRTTALESMSRWREVAATVAMYCKWLLTSRRSSTIESELEILNLVYWFLPHDLLNKPCLPTGSLSIDTIRYYVSHHNLFNV